MPLPAVLIAKRMFNWCQHICWAESLKEYGELCYVQTPMHALKVMFPMPPQEFIRPSMYLSQTLPVSIPCKVRAVLTHSQQ